MTQVRRSGMMTAILACLLLAGCVVVSDLEQAREAADDGDHPRALGLYQRHLEEHPGDFDARLEYTLLLGEAWAYQGGSRDPLLDNLERLYEAQPDNLRVKELYAMMLVREGQAAAEATRHEEAERLYLQAIDIHPDVGTAHYWLGRLYERRGRSEESFRQYVAAAMKRPPLPDLYLRLGRAYLERGDLDRAINTLELVGELRGMSTYLLPEMHCEMARAYQRRGEQDRVREHLESASEDCSVVGAAGGA